MADRVEIYTDGGCDPNPGPGGWGAVLISGTHRKEISGAEARTTNNRMELTAAIQALRLLTRPCMITLYTDSTYLKRGVTEWLPGWQARNWKRASGGSVVNQDLWQDLAAAADQHQISWRWLRGHVGHAENERADRLATQARRDLLAGRLASHKARQPAASRPQQKLPVVEIYSRGCALATPGPSGYGAVVVQNDDETLVSGGWPVATNNVMEIQAVIAALRSLERPSQVAIYTVSKYLHDGATRWITGWERSGWTKKDGTPVRNQELWRELSHLMGDHDVRWEHQPAQAGDGPSARAAAAARQAAEAEKAQRSD